MGLICPKAMRVSDLLSVNVRPQLIRDFWDCKGNGGLITVEVAHDRVPMKITEASH